MTVPSTSPGIVSRAPLLHLARARVQTRRRLVQEPPGVWWSGGLRSGAVVSGWLRSVLLAARAVAPRWAVNLLHVIHVTYDLQAAVGLSQLTLRTSDFDDLVRLSAEQRIHLGFPPEVSDENFIMLS